MVNDVVGGWKTFVKKQKTEPGECVISLVQFDDRYETPFTAVPVQNLSSGDLEFAPRGSTALRDAIGRTINSVGARIRSMRVANRPSKVSIIVMTDGEENASHEFTQEQIKKMVEHQTDKYGWDFIFLGANIDSFEVGRSYGVLGQWTANYTYTGGGLRSAFDTVSCYASTTRTGGTLGGTLSECQAKNEAENLAKNLNTTSGTSTGTTGGSAQNAGVTNTI
jgi:uncharacterized protein YegL